MFTRIVLNPTASADDVLALYERLCETANNLADEYELKYRQGYESCEHCAKQIGGPSHFNCICRSKTTMRPHCTADSCY
jgi:hypothetical protein